MKSKLISDPLDPFDNPLNMDGAEVYTNFFPASIYPAPGYASGSPSTGSPPLILPPLTPTLPAESVEAQAAQNGSGGPGSVVAETSSTGFTINLEFDAAAMAAPASFRAGIEQAASILSATITNKITVNLNIDYSGTGGGAAAGPDNGQFVSYSTVRADLISNATPGDTTFNALPTGSTIQGQSSVAVWNAQLKLFGLLPANSTTTDDGSATFSTDINPNLLVGVALHELTHAMGRVPYGTEPDIFDFYRFTSAGTRLFSDSIPTSAAYFSVDGGNTKLADFGLYSDPSDFLNAGPTQLGAPYSSLTPNDAFDEIYGSNTTQGLSAVDKQMLDALGFNTITAAYQPPVVTASNVIATRGQSIAASNLLSVTDANGYQITVYAFEDSTSGSGHFVFNGVTEPSGQYFLVSQAQLSEVSFVAGAPGSIDTLSTNVFDGTDWGNGATFQVSVPAAIPPVVSASNVITTRGQSIAASNLLSVTDANGYQITVYAFEDSTSGSGHFVFNGVTEPSGQYFLVSQAQLSEVSFVAGAPGSVDTLSTNVFDGTDWGNGATFQVSVPAAIPPVVSASNVIATSGQSIAASNLLSVTDANGYQITVYAFEDSTSGSGHFVFNGVTEPSGQYFLVSQAQLSEVSFVAGAPGSIDTLSTNVFDGTDWGNGATFQVSVPAAIPPVVSASNVITTRGQSIAASNLLSVTDANGYQITVYAFEDSTSGSGHFVFNGVTEPSGQYFLVSQAQLSEVSFVAGAPGSVDTLSTNVFDGTDWGNGATFQVSVPAAIPPVVSASNVIATSGQSIAASNLLSVTDANGYQITVYAFEDSTSGSGHFVFNGVTEPSGQYFLVSQAQLSEVSFVAGAAGSTDSLSVNIFDSTDWGNGTTFQVSVPASAPTTGFETVSVSAGTQLALANASGSATIGAHATLEITAAASASVTFQASTGTLQIDHSSTFTGEIFNFTGDGNLSGSDQIDLRDVNYTTVHDTFSNGVLTVTDGTHTAELDFVGSYVLANFDFVDDGNGGTIVYDPPVIGQSKAATDAATAIIHATGSSTIAGSAGLGSDQVVVDSGATLTLNNVVATAGTITNNDTVDITNNSAVSIAAGTGQDNFVFAPNFGQATLTHFMPGTDSIQIDHTVFASLNALFAAIHDDAHGNAVITDAAHDTITVQNVTTAQLLAHQGDFHLV